MQKILIIVAIIAAGGIIWFAVNTSSSKNENLSSSLKNATLQGEGIPILGRSHVPEGTKVINYNSNPPTSGNHWPSPADWGIYDIPLPDEQLVHNLEHGGIWITYKDIDNETKERLNTLAGKYPQAVIMTPREDNDSAIAVVSWGRVLKLESYDEQDIEEFIQSNINNSPEKFASLEQPAVGVGNSFPDFELTEVDGRKITRDSLKGKPLIVWFTTEFCVPCQIGARKVAKLDDELGGNAFDVLVVFVDPRETKEDLISWRDKFANNDWMVAFDNFNEGSSSLSGKIGLKFLDTKYLLDEEGIIQNIDLQIADEEYLNVIRNTINNS